MPLILPSVGGDDHVWGPIANAALQYLDNATTALAGVVNSVISRLTTTEMVALDAQAVADAAVPATGITDVGDILVGSGTHAVSILHKGDPLQVLRVKSDGSTLEYATPSGGGGGGGGRILCASTGSGNSQSAGDNDGNANGTTTKKLLKSDTFVQIWGNVHNAPTYNNNSTGDLEGSWIIQADGLYRFDVNVVVASLYGDYSIAGMTPERVQIVLGYVDTDGTQKLDTDRDTLTFSSLIEPSGSKLFSIPRPDPTYVGDYRTVSLDMTTRLTAGEVVGAFLESYYDSTGRYATTPAPWILNALMQITQVSD